MKTALMILLLCTSARADILSTDSSGQVSVTTVKSLNLCVDSASAACGVISAGVGESGRVGINNIAPTTALDVTGTVTATAVTATTLTGTVTGASSLNVLKTGDTMTGQLTISAASSTITGAGGLGVTYGVIAGSAAFTSSGGAVSVSTSATSAVSICLAGAFQTLPTSGYAKGCFAYQLSDATPYVSTMTVTEAGDWKALY